MLPKGDVWAFIDAKGRRNLFRKHVRVSGKAHPTSYKHGKTMFKRVLLTKVEKSVTDTKHATQQLTEAIHMAYNATTVIDRRNYLTYEGTNRSDLMGPIHATKRSDLPKLDVEKMALFFLGSGSKQ